MPPAPPETDALARARREIEALGAASRALGTTSDVGPALARIAAAAREVAGADLAYVTGHDAGSGVPRVLARARTRWRGPGATASHRRRRRSAGESSASPSSSRTRWWASSWSPGRAEGGPATSTWRRSAGSPASPPSPSGTDAWWRRSRAAGIPQACAPRIWSASPGQLRRIVDAAKDGIVTTDGGGLITSANPAAEALFGHPAGALSGRPVAVILPGSPAGRHLRGAGRRRERPRGRPAGWLAVPRRAVGQRRDLRRRPRVRGDRAGRDRPQGGRADEGRVRGHGLARAPDPPDRPSGPRRARPRRRRRAR